MFKELASLWRLDWSPTNDRQAARTEPPQQVTWSSAAQSRGHQPQVWQASWVPGTLSDGRLELQRSVALSPGAGAASVPRHVVPGDVQMDLHFWGSPHVLMASLCDCILQTLVCKISQTSRGADAGSPYAWLLRSPRRAHMLQQARRSGWVKMTRARLVQTSLTAACCIGWSIASVLQQLQVACGASAPSVQVSQALVASAKQ